MYLLGMLKHPIFVEGVHSSKLFLITSIANVALDLANCMRHRVLDVGWPLTLYAFCPLLYALHTLLEEDCGIEEANGQVRLPESLPLTMSSLDASGIYLLDDGLTTLIWIGSRCPSSCYEELFTCGSTANLVLIAAEVQSSRDYTDRVAAQEGNQRTGPTGLEYH